MEREVSNVTKTKTDEELVHILIHKDEYKEHIVEAATEELRLREKSKASSQDSVRVVHPTLTPRVDHNPAPPSLYFAGILFLVCAPVVAFLAFSQAAASTVTDDDRIAALSMWNFLCSILYVTFGIGILQRARWGYSWGWGLL